MWNYLYKGNSARIYMLFKFYQTAIILYIRQFLQHLKTYEWKNENAFVVSHSRFILLKLAGEVELNFFKVLLCHTEHIARVGKEYISPFNIFCHILVLALFETFECC